MTIENEEIIKSLQEISQKLNILIASTLTDNWEKRNRGEIIAYLSDMGLDAKDISKITGSPLTSVRTQLTPKNKK